MENASKALLMVAGVLVGVMILSLGVYLFSVFGDSSTEINRRLEQAQIDEFNSQFTKYANKSDLTIHDIVTVANLAKSNNANYEYTVEEINSKIWQVSNNQITNPNAPNYIYVGVITSSNRFVVQDFSEDELINKLIKENLLDYNKIKVQSFEPTFNAVTGKVQGMVFKINLQP